MASRSTIRSSFNWNADFRPDGSIVRPIRWQSGSAFDVRNNGVRVDLVGEPYTGNSKDRYLNRAAFTPAPAGRFGNLARNSLRSPSTNQLNRGVAKYFNVWETLRVQFRADFFNLFNTPQLTQPNTDLNNTSNVDGFGIIHGTYQFTNRQIQFGLRIEF